MKKLITTLLCLALAISFSACNPKEIKPDASSAGEPSSEVSSTVSSEAPPPPDSASPSSETPSSQAVSSANTSSKPVSGTTKQNFFESNGNLNKPAVIRSDKKFTSSAVKWQDRPMKEAASKNFKITYDGALFNKDENKYIIDADGDPVYDAKVNNFTFTIFFKDGHVDTGAPAAFYRRENGKWVLLNEETANKKTDQVLFEPLTDDNLTYSVSDEFNGVLTKAGKYMMEKQVNDKIVSFTFSVVTNAEWQDNWQEAYSTNATLTFDKNTYPVGTETIQGYLTTGNGRVVGGDLAITLFKEVDGKWEVIYQPVPKSLGSMYPKGGVFPQNVFLGGYLNEAGKFKLKASLNEELQTELVFTVE